MLAALPAAAQAPSDTLRADFHGRIVYSGSYSGKQSIPGRTLRRLDLGSLLESAMSGSSRQYSGGYNVQIEVNGNAVSGRYGGSGGIDSVTFSGTRNGDACRLFDDSSGAAILARCTASTFAGTVASPVGARQPYKIQFEAQATQFVDATEEQRRLALAEQAERNRPRTVAVRGAVRQASTSAPTAPLVITTAALGIGLDELLDRVVYADSQSWGLNRYVRGSMHNARYLIVNKAKTTYTAYGEYQFATFGGGAPGWVKVKVRNGQLECLEFHDQAGSCRPLFHSLSQQVIAGTARGMAEDTLGGGSAPRQSNDDAAFDAWQQSQDAARAAQQPAPPPPPPVEPIGGDRGLYGTDHGPQK
jgi:hypothetical protein